MRGEFSSPAAETARVRPRLTGNVDRVYGELVDAGAEDRKQPRNAF
jgi:hypothetical protein